METSLDRILVVDDDVGIAEMLRGILRSEGFEVLLAHDGPTAVSSAIDFAPDVILLDVMMPGMDGLEVCRQLRTHPKTHYIGIIMVTAMAGASSKVMGLRAGADDFVTKPFDPDELLERVRTALRRSRELSGLNPLTRLPGNEEIRRRIEERIGCSDPFALMHIDIDNFKAFNDYYGLQRGDVAIGALADCLRDAAQGEDRSIFIGHTGGDDMVVLANPLRSQEIAAELIAMWDARVGGLYEEADVKRGFLETVDRNGQLRRFPPMTLSIGIAVSDQRGKVTDLQISDIASRMKNIAKRRAVSSYEMDRRGGPLRVDEIAVEGELGLPPADNKTLLVVDDNPLIREVVTLYCVRKGFQVFEASNGIEAYQMTVQHRPAFVVLDYKMPELDGESAAELIREVAPQATIIALSAFLDSKPEWADAFIEKHQLDQIGDVLERLGAKQTKSEPIPE